MRIALIQMNCCTGDFEGNLKKALTFAQEAVQAGADFAIFPRAALCGGLGTPLLDDYEFAFRANETSLAFAKRTPLPSFIGGMFVGASKPALGEEAVCEVSKSAPGKKSACEDARPVSAWKDARPVSAREGILYCNNGKIDTFVDPPGRDAFFDLRGSQLHCHITTTPAALGKQDIEASLPTELYISFDSSCRAIDDSFMDTHSLLGEYAKRKQCWLIYSNPVGAQDDQLYAGACCVVSPQGFVSASAPAFEETLLLADILLDGDSKQDESLTTRVQHQSPTRTVSSFEIPAIQALFESLVMATRDYYHKNGMNSCVIGLSGGIDSAVVAAIAVEALGSKQVHGVLMPGPFSSEGSLSDALALASNLGIETDIIPITPAFEALVAVLNEHCGGAVAGLALENLQARIRMLYLMTLSNTYGWAMLNTGNKSESAMGFSTLYGDTAGAFSPLGDVYKTRVYELAHYINKSGERIPRAIIDKPPSAELCENQRDDDRLPPYEILDQILEASIEDKQPAHITASSLGIDETLVREVLATVNKMEFKRRQEPPAPKVSRCSFKKRDWPITNRLYR